MSDIQSKINKRRASLGSDISAKIAARRAKMVGPTPEDLARADAADAIALEQMQDMGPLKATVLGATNGVTLGFADEIIGGATSLMGGDGAAATQRVADAKNLAREQYPKTALASEIAGGMLLPFGAIKTAGQAIKVGAAVGGTYALGEGTGTGIDRIKGVPLGMVAGAAGGAIAIPAAKAVSWAAGAFGKAAVSVFSKKSMYDPAKGITEQGRKALAAAGLNPDEVSAKFVNHFQKLTDAAVEPQTAARSANMAEFNIPANKANVTGAVDDFATLERTRRVGGAGSAKVGAALDAQDAAMRRAGDDIATGLGGGKPADQFDAAVAVSERLRGIVAEEKGAAQAAYRAADKAGFSVDPSAARGVVQRINTRLADEEVDLVSGALSESRSVMNRLERRGVMTSGNKGVSLRLIDGARKDINKTLRTATGEDERALQIIKGEYDVWLDDVISAKMFEGDAAGVTKLKEARGLWASYAQKFAGKDKGSKFLQSMVDTEASPDEVVRWLFSAGKLGTGKMNSSLANTLKTTLGETSDEWNMVRQAAFRQLTEKPEGTTQWGAQKLATNIGDFFTAPGTRALSQEMFSAEERALIMRFQGALKQMIPPPGSVNHSGTAYELNRMGGKLLEGLSASLGLATGGPAGAIAASGATKGAGAVKNWLQVRSVLDGIAKAAPKGTRTAVPAALAGGRTGSEVTNWLLPSQPK